MYIKKIYRENSEDIICVLERALKGIELRSHNFICLAIDEYAETFASKELAKAFLVSNRPSPTMHKRFYNNRFYNKSTFMTSSWWESSTSTSGDNCREQRVKFLKYLLNHLKKC